MIIRKLDKDKKVKFDDICNIIIDQTTRRVVHSNHPRIKPGHPVSEEIQRNAIGHGWNVIRRNPDKLLTEQVSVEDLLNNVILGAERDGRWTVFEKDDEVVFAQNTEKGKVCVENLAGEKKYYNTVDDFLKSISGFQLAGVLDDEDKEEEQKGEK